MRMINYIFTGFCLVYGILTLIAMPMDIKANGLMFYHPIYVVGALLLIVCPFLPKRTMLLIIALIAIHAAAILTGLSGKFHLSHHIVRAIISIILIYGSVFLSRAAAL